MIQGSRLQWGSALAIDCAIIYVLVLSLLTLAGLIIRGLDSGMFFIVDQYFSEEWSLQLLIDFTAVLLYFGLFVYLWNGLTPGKKLLHLRIVSLKSRKITFWQAFDRAFYYMVSILTLFFGFFRYFTNPARQAKHDKIVDTIVVDTGTRTRGRKTKAGTK